MGLSKSNGHCSEQNRCAMGDGNEDVANRRNITANALGGIVP